MNSKVIVHLVHGTWPYGPFQWEKWDVVRAVRRLKARWWHEGEKFRTSLSSELAAKGVDVEIVPFEWSGENTFAARLEAGRRFRKTFEDRKAQNPDAKHIVVAHSHGGTVASYAFGNGDGPGVDKPDGMISLATPFVYLRKYAQPAGRADMAFSMRYFCSTIVALILMPVLLASVIFGPMYPLVAFCILGLICAVDIGRRQKRFDAFFIEQRTRPNYPFPIVSIRAPGDEASGMISVALGIAKIQNFLQEKFIQWFSIVNLIVLVVIGYQMYFGAEYIDLLFFWLTFSVAFTGGWLFLEVVATVVQSVATGKELLDFSSFSFVQSEVLPPATSATVVMIPLSDEELQGFKHSIYEYESCRSTVASCVLELAAVRAPEGKAQAA